MPYRHSSLALRRIELDIEVGREGGAQGEKVIKKQPPEGKKFKIDYDPHPAQQEIHDDNHRFRIAVCGRKFGKTTLAVAELIFNAIFKKQESANWYVAPTYRQAKQIAWKLLQKMIPPELVIRRHELELSITLFNKSVIELKGADNPDSLRGVDIDLCVMDEYAFMRPEIWEEIIRPNLTATLGEGIFIGTPYGYNHFYNIYMMGQEGNELSDPDYKSWKKPSAENPYLPEGEIESAKRELTESSFAQEYLADFRSHTGKIYNDFDREVHVIPPFDTPSSWTYGRYMDRGWRVPTGVGFVGIDENDNIYIIDEIYEPNLTNPQLAEMIKDKSQGRYFWNSYADSAQASDLEDLASLGVYFTPVKKSTGERLGEWIRSGIEKISERLKIQPGTGKPKLFVFSNCKNHLFEFENYSWNDKKTDEYFTERPRKKNDHLMDGLRYFIIMYKREEPVADTFSEKKRNWSFT